MKNSPKFPSSLYTLSLVSSTPASTPYSSDQPIPLLSIVVPPGQILLLEIAHPPTNARIDHSPAPTSRSPATPSTPATTPKLP